ncbi:unnamed protein product [Calypogeia fissa]
MGCSIPPSRVDGGSGVNVILEAIVHKLGIHQLEPTCSTMRMANGARVILVGTLLGLGTRIGGVEFPLNYLVMKPNKPSGYPVLLGRPWLYGVDVVTDWTKKKFRFRRPEVRVSWGEQVYEGATPQEEEWYDSDITPDEAEAYEEEVYLMQYLNALTKQEVFFDRYATKEVAVNLIEAEELLAPEGSRGFTRKDPRSVPTSANEAA